MRRLTLPTLAALALLGGCADEKKDDTLQSAGAACEAVKGFLGEVFRDCMGFTVEAAAAFIDADPGLDCAAWDAAVADGTVTFDGGKAMECLGSLGSVTCNQVLWANENGVELFPYACSQALQGSLVADDPCAHDFECASGVCEFPLACDAPGACRDAPALGETCAGSAPYCEGGLACDAGTCAIPPPIPVPVAVGQDCAAAPCVDAAYCRAADDKCVARPTDGMACSASNPCTYDSRCTDLLCQRIVPPGGACTFGDTDCATGASCVTIASLAAATTCQRQGGAGAKCGWALASGPTWEYVGCVDAWCDAALLAPGTCQPWTAPGEPCGALTGECGPSNGYACTAGTCERLTCDPG